MYLSLCSKEESAPRGGEDYLLCESCSLIIPTRKMTLEEINLAVVKLSELISIGPVFVHCKAAVERSPLICIAWLVKNKSLTIQQS